MFTFYNYRIYKQGDTYKVVYFPEYVPDDFVETGHRFLNFENNKNSAGRFLSSISRARSTVFDLGLCNEWTYFFTITFDERKVFSRDTLYTLLPRVTRFFRDCRLHFSCPISFVAIPELHADKQNWHLHGLCTFPRCGLFHFLSGPLFGSSFLNCPLIQDKFGFCSFSEIRSREAVSRYILKYVGKGFSSSMIRSGQPLYTCSRGLKRKEFLFSGVVSSPFTDTIDFDFCSVSNNLSFSDIKNYLDIPPQV